MHQNRDTFTRLMKREGSPVLTWVMSFFNEKHAEKLLGAENVPKDCIPREEWNLGASDASDRDRKINYARATGNFAIGVGWGACLTFGHGGPGEFRNRLIETGENHRLTQYETGVISETCCNPHYYNNYNHPVKGPADLAGLILPDASDPARYAGIKEEVEYYKNHDFVTYANLNGFLSGIHRYLYKYDDLLADLISKPDFIDGLLAKIGEFNLTAARKLLECGVDMITFCDDLGSGSAFLMSPELYRRFFKPWHAKLADLCHEYGAYLHMHSHGNINGIIGDLYEIGIDMLNPNDPAEQMDLPNLKRKYGDRIVFTGGIHKYFFEWDIGRQNEYFKKLLTSADGEFIVMEPGGVPENVSEKSFENFKRLLDEAKSGNERDFYVSHLKYTILPFWMRNSIDEKYGGFFTCFNNSGEKLLSTDKYVWSQGSMIWIISQLAESEIFTRNKQDVFRALAARGAKFLMKHCLLENGSCAAILTREGQPKPAVAGGRCDNSIYADCFAVYGLAAYAGMSGDIVAYMFAKKLYQSIQDRFENGDFLSEPYQPPAGYRMHGFYMINLMISQQMSEAAADFNDVYSAIAEGVSHMCAEKIMNGFVNADGVLLEMLNDGSGLPGDGLFDRFTNPGHTLESMWIVMEHAKEDGDEDLLRRAADVVKKAFVNGWDDKFGGIVLYADKDGGQPKGTMAGIEKETMAAKITADWDNKLWWVHSEALYSTLLAYKFTGRVEFDEMYGKIFDYVFKTFPSPSNAAGEWIQIRDRGGQPIDKNVALPMKDPFHIMRNLLRIIDIVAN